MPATPATNPRLPDPDDGGPTPTAEVPDESAPPTVPPTPPPFISAPSTPVPGDDGDVVLEMELRVTPRSRVDLGVATTLVAALAAHSATNPSNWSVVTMVGGGGDAVNVTVELRYSTRSAAALRPRLEELSTYVRAGALERSPAVAGRRLTVDLAGTKSLVATPHPGGGGPGVGGEGGAAASSVGIIVGAVTAGVVGAAAAALAAFTFRRRPSGHSPSWSPPSPRASSTPWGGDGRGGGGAPDGYGGGGSGGDDGGGGGGGGAEAGLREVALRPTLSDDGFQTGWAYDATPDGALAGVFPSVSELPATEELPEEEEGEDEEEPWADERLMWARRGEGGEVQGRGGGVGEVAPIQRSPSQIRDLHALAECNGE